MKGFTCEILQGGESREAGLLSRQELTGKMLISLPLDYFA